MGGSDSSKKRKDVKVNCENCGKAGYKSNLSKHRKWCKGKPFVKKSRQEINRTAYEKHKDKRLLKKRTTAARNVFTRLQGKKWAMKLS